MVIVNDGFSFLISSWTTNVSPRLLDGQAPAKFDFGFRPFHSQS